MKNKTLKSSNNLTTGGYKVQNNTLDYLDNTAKNSLSKQQGIFSAVTNVFDSITGGISNIIGTKKSLDNESEAIQATKATTIEGISSKSTTIVTVICCVVLGIVIFIVKRKKS